MSGEAHDDGLLADDDLAFAGGLPKRIRTRTLR